MDKQPIEDLCNKDIGTLYRLATDRTRWTHFVKFISWTPTGITFMEQEREKRSV